MQLLRGSTREALLNHADYQSSPPSVAWAAAIAAQIAAVLADVHRVDIVHRDIKPGNVLIADGGLVKVLDFGIAILRGAGALPRLPPVDRTVGTAAYMSPEHSGSRDGEKTRDPTRPFRWPLLAPSPAGASGQRAGAGLPMPKPGCC
jgi:serine/threonine protein kinase